MSLQGIDLLTALLSGREALLPTDVLESSVPEVIKVIEATYDGNFMRLLTVMCGSAKTQVRGDWWRWRASAHVLCRVHVVVTGGACLCTVCRPLLQNAVIARLFNDSDLSKTLVNRVRSSLSHRHVAAVEEEVKGTPRTASPVPTTPQSSFHKKFRDSLRDRGGSAKSPTVADGRGKAPAAKAATSQEAPCFEVKARHKHCSPLSRRRSRTCHMF